MNKQEKVKGLAGTLYIIFKVFFWAAIIFAAAFALGALLTVFLPSDLMKTANIESMRLSLGSTISFSIGDLGDVSFKPVLLAILISCAVALPLFAAICWQLAGILKTVKEDRPFADENAKRLMIIGIVLLNASWIFKVIETVTASVIITAFSIPNISISYNIVDSTILFMGLLVLILAGVFKYGSYLQNEYDATL
ncbi:MAG TPA: hypothetical protein DG577_05285 [Firmicutes bacterium]|jgi:hypothetical protein|nr:hypothetical protein [Bacillota bacterium]